MLSARKRLILVKKEDTYGEDSTPSGSNAILIQNPDVSPLEAETVERNLIRPYFGQAERLMTQTYAKATFEVELGGHGGGVVGQKPAIDDLICACGFEGEQKTLSVAIASSDGVATVTCGTHTYNVGDKVKISGAEQSEYNGIKTITAKTSTTFSYVVTGSPASPATGTIVMDSSYEYTPISEDIPSVTIYHNIDGVLHKITGAKGTFSIGINVKSIPVFKFDFTGLNNVAVDAEAPTADYSSFSIPQVVNTENTTGYSLLGHSGALESFEFSLNNEVNYVTLVGREYVNIFDRKATGSVSFEATTVAEKDFWTACKDQETGSLAITHGSQNSNIVSLTFPKVLLDSPKYKESNSVMMITCGVSIMPDDGNDEITIAFR